MNSFVMLAVIALLIFLAIISVIAVLVYLRITRHSKDIERSLKMVPLLLKIPPQETGEGNRDERELVKENIPIN